MGKKQRNPRPDRNIRIRGERRQHIDETKLSLAIWLLAKGIVEDRTKSKPDVPEASSGEAA